MIRALSPYYITVPLQYTTSSTQTCEYFKLNIKVWSGLESSVPSTVDYTIVYDNTNSETGDHTINVAPLLRDFIEFTPQDNGLNYGVLDSDGNQKWVKTYVEYDGGTTDYQPVTELFSSGYSYGTDGVNAETRGPDNNDKPQILLEDNDYTMHRGGIISVPISLEDIATTTIGSVRSYPSLTQISETLNISPTTDSDSLIKNVWIDTTNATTDEYVRVSFNGDFIDFILKDEFRHDPMTVFFINKYGAQQTFIFFKEKRESIAVTDNTFESNIGQPSTGSHQFLRYNVQARTTIKASSGFITEDENEAIKQMMLSERVWMYDVTDGLTPLNIKTTSTSFKTRQKERLINYDIDFLKGYNDINNI
jgi:hypothetical protein